MKGPGFIAIAKSSKFVDECVCCIKTEVKLKVENLKLGEILGRNLGTARWCNFFECVIVLYKFYKLSNCFLVHSTDVVYFDQHYGAVHS